MTEKPEKPVRPKSGKPITDLTPKQLAFCREYAKDPTVAGAERAYRKYYSARGTPETVVRAVKRIRQHPAVKAYMQGAKEQMMLNEHKRAALSLEGHLDKLAELRDSAAADGAYSAAVSAEKCRGQVMGYYVEKQQVQGDICITWKDNATDDEEEDND